MTSPAYMMSLRRPWSTLTWRRLPDAVLSYLDALSTATPADGTGSSARGMG